MIKTAYLYLRYIRRRLAIVTEDHDVYVKVFMCRLMIVSAATTAAGALLCSLPSPWNGLGQTILFLGTVCLSAAAVSQTKQLWRER